MAVVVGLFMFSHQYERPNLKSLDKILQIKGKVDKFSFLHKQGYRATLTQYYIWLDNYPCTFQIKADFTSFFDQKGFENDIKIGDIVNLTIPKEFESQLYEREKHVFIFSASKNSKIFLSLTDTIPKENDNFDIYAGLFFIMGGIVLYSLTNRGLIK